jgi:predicted P-loop ATPase
MSEKNAHLIADLVEGLVHDNAPTKDNPEWRKELSVSERGQPTPLLANAITVLRNSHQWRGVILLDEFSSELLLAESPPWKDKKAPWRTRPWEPNDDIQTANWLQREGIAVNVSVAAQAVSAVSEDRKFHPVIDYLNGLKWDGIPRLNTWVSKYLGGAATAYHTEIGRCSLIAAIARIRKPGCKVDTIPIMEGAQGSGKSTALRVLFDPWFSDEIADFGSKDAAMQIRGTWLIEISELDAMSRSDVGRIKAFVSRTVDRFRPPYGTRVIESPRSCVFWGTTNSDNYLKDESGGRRFWPIKTSSIDNNNLSIDRDQLWAEAQVRYNNGEQWWINDLEVQKTAVEEQRARYDGDAWDLMISEYLATRSEVSVDEILRLVIKLEPGQWSQAHQNRVARCLKSNGWIRFQLRIDEKRAYRYKRVSACE